MTLPDTATRAKAREIAENLGRITDDTAYDNPYRILTGQARDIILELLSSGEADGEPVAWRWHDDELGLVSTGVKKLADEARALGSIVEPLYRHPAPREAGVAPCIQINEDSQTTDIVIEDTAYVAKPLLDGIHHWIDKHEAMDDGRLVGVTIWATKPPTPREALPADVRALVIAARIVSLEDQSPDALKRLDVAAEAFADRVPWDDEPDSELASPVPGSE